MARKRRKYQSSGQVSKQSSHSTHSKGQSRVAKVQLDSNVFQQPKSASTSSHQQSDDTNALLLPSDRSNNKPYHKVTITKPAKKLTKKQRKRLEKIVDGKKKRAKVRTITNGMNNVTAIRRLKWLCPYSSIAGGFCLITSKIDSSAKLIINVESV